MGQHKYNPTAIAAKEGKLPPKQKKMSKAELNRELHGMIWSELVKRSPSTAAIVAALSTNESYGRVNHKEPIEDKYD